MRRLVPVIRNPRILIVVLAAALMGAFFMFGGHRSDPEFYENALRDAHARQTVTIRGVPYVVTDGRVTRGGTAIEASEALHALELAYELTAAQRAPLIALPGTDPTRLDAAIVQMQEVSETLGQLQPASLRETVRNDLYPFMFLRAASKAERARRTFLESGRDTDARAYEQSLSDAAHAYVHDLDAFERGFKAAVPDTAPRYITERNANDYVGMLTIIGTARDAMRGTSQRLRDRIGCVHGDEKRCDTRDLAFPTVDVPDTARPTKSQIAYARQKLTLPPLRELLAGTDRANEPLLKLQAPSCTQDMPGTTFFMLRDAKDATGAPYKVAAYVGNGRLVDISSRSDVGFFKYFLDHGVRYIPSTPMVYYECLNFTRDVSELLSLELARRVALRSPLSASAAEPRRRDLARLETAFSPAAFAITQKDGAAYSALALQAAQDGALATSSMRQAVELALAMHNGSALYENQLLDMSEIERTNAILYTRGIEIGLDATSLFYTRSGFAALFMMYNPSVTGITEDIYAASEVPAAKQPYVYYDSLSTAERAKADSDKDFYYRVHANPTVAQ